MQDRRRELARSGPSDGRSAAGARRRRRPCRRPRRPRPGRGRTGCRRPGRRRSWPAAVPPPDPVAGAAVARSGGRRGRAAPRSRRSCRHRSSPWPARRPRPLPVVRVGSGSSGVLKLSSRMSATVVMRRAATRAAGQHRWRSARPGRPSPGAMSDAASVIGIAKPRPSASVETAVLTPMTRAGRVEERPAAVAGVDRGVRLEQAGQRVGPAGRLVPDGDRPAGRRQDALGHRLGERAERAADGDDRLADLERAEVADDGRASGPSRRS